MGSEERWVYLKEGKIYLHVENDGPQALKRGLESSDKPVELKDLECYPNLLQKAKKLIEPEKLPEGTKVLAKFGIVELTGEIVGIATNELASIGHVYIIKIGSSSGLDRKEYPYSCLCLPQSMFVLQKK